MGVSLFDSITGAFAKIGATSKALSTQLVDSAGNPIIYAKGDDVRETEGLLVGGSNDGNYRRFRTDRMGSQAIANLQPMLYEPFEGTAVALHRLFTTATTMSVAQTNTGALFNSGGITTINTGIMLSSRKHFPRIMCAPIHLKQRARIEHYNNSVVEMGFGFGNTATASPTVGAYFQITNTGTFQGVLTFNGVEVATVPMGIVLTPTNHYTFDVIMDDDSARFIVQDTSTGLLLSDQTISLSLTQGRLSNATHLPCFTALRNTAIAPATRSQINLTDLYVGLLDNNIGSVWTDRSAQMGFGANYSPTLMNQTANAANSTAPVNATLSNTAAGYTTLGGRFGFAAVAGAVTDYDLFGFAVPSPYQFTLKGIDIETYNTGAAVATTATLLDWFIGTNGASANLASGAFIRDFVGSQSFAVGAAIGAKAERISTKFDTPIVCEAGLTLALILRMPVGSATASQVIQGGVKFHGFFE